MTTTTTTTSPSADDTLCETCGWTFGMVCPECSKGCGCSVGCTGWRHGEYAGDTDPAKVGGPFCDDDYCEGCDDCSPYGLAYRQTGW
ncbi:hypothetical protein GCM10010302_26660 [Streptomyces polychromogenes]|uniref:4Fe-4S ferredoxin-type domain-containing protein n=1 Tax=Streptomyces polychromogenes TaxID=67342 RepID=A0ABN0VCC5_9ACTN